MANMERERRQIVDYFLAESPAGTGVQRAEKLTSERIFGRKHDVWDVQGSDGRWWVITNPTNLYNHDDHPSMHTAFALHIGVTARLAARESLKAPVDEEMRNRAAAAWRLYEQAAEALDRSDEAEDFQAVGARCRECLITFTTAIADESFVPSGEVAPKKSDFVGWSRCIVGAWTSGARSERPRAYLRNLAEQTWKLVSWLTHEKNATRLDGTLALDATAHTIEMFSLAQTRFELGETDRCPACGSYQLSNDYDVEADLSLRVCDSCDWVGPPLG